jgi:hypothetical protein
MEMIDPNKKELKEKNTDNKPPLRAKNQ